MKHTEGFRCEMTSGSATNKKIYRLVYSGWSHQSIYCKPSLLAIDPFLTAVLDRAD